MDITEELLNLGGSMQQCKTHRKAVDEIERLRLSLMTFSDNVKETNAGIDKNWAETINPLRAENQRLRQQNAELLEALRFYACDCDYIQFCGSYASECGKTANAAIAKATGGE